MENYFAEVTKEVFGEEFKCKVKASGIELLSKDKRFGFSFGFIVYPQKRIARDFFIVYKRFDKIEEIIISLCIKHNILYSNFNNFKPTIQKSPYYSEIPNLNHRFFKKRTMVHVNNRAEIVDLMNELKIAVEYMKSTFVEKYDSTDTVYDYLINAIPEERSILCEPGLLRWIFLRFYKTRDFEQLKINVSNSLQEIKDRKLESHFVNYDALLNDLLVVCKGMV